MLWMSRNQAELDDETAEAFYSLYRFLSRNKEYYDMFHEQEQRHLSGSGLDYLEGVGFEAAPYFRQVLSNEVVDNQ